jgi:uncharacterized protein (DUF305 family)
MRDDASAEASPAPAADRRPMTVVLTAIVVVAALVAATAIGHLWGARGSGSSASSPSATSVDAGFARDMSTHHQQAVTMAGYTRDNTSDPAVKILAYDIETSQYFEIGQMQGWLDSWGLPHQSSATQMAWMAGHAHLQADGLMPGMATPAQMSKLESLHGNALDIFFLQLMIHHHQGGVPMAQYAAAHAGQQYVRDLAQSMVTAQNSEIIQMEQLVRQLGSAPLSPPAD